MTPRTELEACQVTDADRKRLATRYRELAQPGTAEAIENGEMEDHPNLLMLARHRIEAERAAMREAAEIADNPGFIEARDTEWDEGVNFAKRHIAKAILSRIEVPPSSKSASTPEGERR